ncbi:multidrug effflux MFS transporter [Guyparkeria sp. GHLCS8-2]|uniref:multidrug effflux MFS transporter n=1 Tax=Guyparkeria halopsychrophila TaxID=3139421 RepID=UPI0037C8C9C8
MNAPADETSVRADDSPRGRRAAVLVLVIAGLLMLAPFTVDAYLPSFHAMADEFGVGQAAIQQTLSLYLLAFGSMMLFYGPASDSFGRKRVILLALLAYALMTVFAALSQGIGQLIAARVGQGLAAGAGVVIGRALVRDLFAGADAQRVMANVMLIFASAPAAAPIIGGWLHEWFGWRSVFWFLLGFSLLLVIAIWRLLPETVAQRDRQSFALRFVLKSYARALSHPRYMQLVVVFALLFGGMFLYVAAAPAILIDHLGQDETDFWKFFVPLVAGLILGSRLTNWLAGRLSMTGTMALGLGLTGLAVVYNLIQAWVQPADVTHGIWLTVTPITLYVMGMATTMPALNITALDYWPAQRGLASALQGATQMAFAGLVSGVMVAWLADSLFALAVGMACLYLAALGLWLVWYRSAKAEVPA